MHLRRAILLLALVLGLTALAAAVSPTRVSSPPVTQPPPAATPIQPVARSISFVSRPGSKATERTAISGEHVIVSVASIGGGGLVTIPRLGRTTSVSPATPARFDLIAPPPGRYDVLVMGSESSEPRRAGTLVTRP